MDAGAILLIVLLVWIGLLWLFYQWGAGIAEKKGRSRAMGGWIALLFGFIGVLVLYLMSDESVQPYVQHSAPPAPRLSEELERLASLKNKGILTEAEFEQKKRALLG